LQSRSLTSPAHFYFKPANYSGGTAKKLLPVSITAGDTALAPSGLRDCPSYIKSLLSSAHDLIADL
jgi:hypothetical protein